MKTVEDIINTIKKIDSLAFPPDEAYDFEKKTVTFHYDQFIDMRALLWNYKDMLLAIEVIDNNKSKCGEKGVDE